MLEQCGQNREGWRRARFFVLPLAFLLAACPQLRDDDFTRITPVQDAGGHDEPEMPALDASLPSAPGDAGPERDSGPGASSDTNDAGAVQDAGAPGRDAGDEPGCVVGIEICDARDNDCDELVDELTACAADCVGVALQGRGAMYCGGAGTDFATAQARCGDQGMRLVGLDSAEKNTAVVQVAAPLNASRSTVVEDQSSIWIDARDIQTEGTWLRGAAETVFWIGDETGTAQGDAYANWGTGKPNDSGGGSGEDCGVLYVDTGTEGELGTWNDNTCSGLHTFLCEAPPP